MNPKLVYYLIQLLEGLGMGSFFPIYTPWLELHGLNFFKMGAVNFLYHISASILDPFTGFVADKFGKRKSFIVGQIFWTSTQFIYGASSHIGGFLLAEGVAAVGHSMKSDTLESWLQNRLGEKESSRVMGRAKPLFTLGQIFSSILAGYISFKYGMNIAWFASGSFFLAATILGGASLYLAGNDLTELVEDQETSESLSLRQIFSTTLNNKKIVATAILVSILNFACKPLFMYWPQIVVSLNMPVETRGWTILAISIPTMIGTLLSGHNIFITRNRSGFLKILVILGIGLIVSGFAKNLLTFFVGMLLVEITYGATPIVVYGYLYSEVDHRHRSTVNSIISATRTLGGAISLLFMGIVADMFTPQIALVVGGVLILLALIFYKKSKE